MVGRDVTIRDLQPGATLRAIDVSDLSAPRVINEVEVGNRPLDVSVSPDGRTLVLATKTRGSPLTFVTFSDGQFGKALQFPLQNVSEMPELFDGGQLPHHAEWHPTEDVVALTLKPQNLDQKGTQALFKALLSAPATRCCSTRSAPNSRSLRLHITIAMLTSEHSGRALLTGRKPRFLLFDLAN